jgi:hypothetical protein
MQQDDQLLRESLTDSGQTGWRRPERRVVFV